MIGTVRQLPMPLIVPSYAAATISATTAEAVAAPLALGAEQRLSRCIGNYLHRVEYAINMCHKFTAGHQRGMYSGFNTRVGIAQKAKVFNPVAQFAGVTDVHRRHRTNAFDIDFGKFKPSAVGRY